MGEYVFDKQIFKEKFLQGNELRNRAKSTSKNSDSVCPVGSDNTTQFSRVSEEELFIELIHSVMEEKIDAKKLALAESDISLEIEKQIKIPKDILKDVFRNIVNDLYIEKSKNSGVTSLSLLRYKSSPKDSGKQKELGKFAAEVILDEKNRSLLREKVGAISNPMDDIVNKAYANLKVVQADKKEREYTRIFEKELKALFEIANNDIKNALEVYDGAVNEIMFLVSYYMFVYLSQIALLLEGDLDNTPFNNAKFLLFKLGKEPVSGDRDCIVKGWKRVERKTKKIFAHLVLLNMLNSHDNTTKYMTYSELYRLYDKDENGRITMDEAINYLIEEYTLNHKYSADQGDFVDFTKIEYPVGDEGSPAFFQKKIQYLFECIDRQLSDNENRSKVRKNVWSNYEHLMKMRFVRSWGNQGKMLMISNEDLLLMIKICQRSSAYMKEGLGIQIIDLFEEFKRRGLYFDKKSEKYVIDHLRQINLIDSKCDSEEAQYVKRIQ